jgi:hypothetical protein
MAKLENDLKMAAEVEAKATARKGMAPRLLN